MEIKIENLSKEFKGIPALTNINLDFKSGKIYGLTGRNGSGKSVFLKILCGFYRPTTGRVLYDNVDINMNDNFAPNTRALIEKPNFLSDLTGFENLKLLASIQNKIGEKEINETLDRVNLTAEKNKKYSKYSLGTKQKLGIAQVLMENPEVIILDEPLNGIEKETSMKIREILKEEKEKGKLIIVATHLKDDVDTLVDELYEFDAGKVEKIQNRTIMN